MSSTLVFVRLARAHVMQAKRDEYYAKRLLDGFIDPTRVTAAVERAVSAQATLDEVEVLDLQRRMARALSAREPLARASNPAPLGERTHAILHVSIRGYYAREPLPGVHVSWLCLGLDTGYGIPAWIDEGGVSWLASELPAIAAAHARDVDFDELPQLAEFYQRAAAAAQVVIVAEV